MGSAGEEPFKGIDGSVGALVWVRRRNGSWWPGRILSLDELPEGCLPAPRSGTPVKLLGREDASVDWYNLEKSKRVKAFRCGEYDNCIEKAKSLASHLSKKAVKYARREDAILHALELENASLGKDFPDTSTRHDTQEEDQQQQDNGEQSEEDNVNQDLVGISEDDSDSAPEHSQSVVSFEEPKIYLESKRRRTPNDSEDDDGAGRVTKRMRGLQDLGMGVDFERRKRSQVGQGQEFLKKKNRRRTLSKVLERTPLVFVPVPCEQLPSPTGLESNESNKITNNNNSDSANGISCENGFPLDGSGNGKDGSSLGSKGKENEISSVVGVCEDGGSCERLFDVPLIDEEKQECEAGVSKTVSGGSQKAQAGSGPHSSQSSHVETLSLVHEEHNETVSTGSGPTDINNISQVTEKGTSEWQLKGKRNSRPRKIDIDDDAETHTDIRSNRVGGPLLITDVDGFSVKSRSSIKETKADDEFRSWSWNNAPQRDKSSDVLAPQRQLPYRHSRCTVNPKYDSSNFSLRHHTSNNGGRLAASLHDVVVEVETSYRPQHVPYISLMSKLNRKPVVGHPISVEVLEDGYLGSECYSSCSERVYKDQRHLGRFSEQKPRRRTPSKRRSKSKSIRNGLLSKKIRKLSLLTGSQRRSQHDKKPILESFKGPSIACVPLKVVFSRITASLNNLARPQPQPRMSIMSGT